ncbi:MULTISPECIES: helix-turn-helix domain-containing protein [unclassified Streptomyces]|uniref:helix-turn-helix domain-containing protein n=1 Tax=unclassified Streptomyces TaxID=2593676 RepID=UPI001F10160B|nr:MULTISPECIES: helix-turn-helix domain-containing protein [unclassified Streptomyces]
MTAGTALQKGFDRVTMTVIVSTDQVPPRDRQAFFADAVMQTHFRHDMTFLEGPGPFSASITTDQLGPLRINRVLSGPAHASRTRRLLSHDPEEYVTVGLHRRGAPRMLAQDGRETGAMRPGDMVILTSYGPYASVYTEPVEIVSVMLPRPALLVPDSDLHGLTGGIIPGDEGLGRLLSPFLSRLADTAASHTPEVGEQLARNVTDLLATLCAERLAHDRIDAETAERALLLRIRFFINRNLAQPGLSPESIARAHGISTRYLHKLFKGEGMTVSRWILRRRLEECRRELDPRGPRTPTVSSVARRWGFTHLAHFSRAFRAAYGMSPREWQARSSLPALGRPLPDMPEQGTAT